MLHRGSYADVSLELGADPNVKVIAFPVAVPPLAELLAVKAREATMTVSIILAAKGREVGSVSNRTPRLPLLSRCSPNGVSARRSFWELTAALSASSRSATSCARWANVALPRLTIR
jgi:hypothetical protein